MSYSLEAIYRSTVWAVGSNSSAMSSLQEKAATGQDVNRLSDDPGKANQLLGFISDQREKEHYIDTLDELVSVLDLSSSVVQSMTEEISRARATLTSTLSGTTSDQLGRTLAEDLNNSLEQLVDFANTQRLGQYLYGGAQSDEPPYVVTRNDAGDIIAVEYQGSYEELDVEVSPGLEMSAVLVGDDLFRADTAESPTFYGETGAAAGTGTSSVRGDVLLEVTDLGGGSYGLSIDGGANTVTVDGSETNVAVVNSETGEVLYVDATGITEAGTEPIQTFGTYDIFNSLINARDLLNNSDDLDEGQRSQMLQALAAEIQDVEEKLVSAFPVVGGRVQTLTNLRDSMEQIKVNSEEEISRLRDADITEVAIDLARYEVLYQMSLNVAAKMFSMNLLDFIS